MKESRETRKKLADLVADALQKAEKQQGYWMNYSGGAFAQAASASSKSARPMTVLMKVLQQEDRQESAKSLETALETRDSELENFKEELLDVTGKIDAHLVPVKPSEDGADYNDGARVIELPELADYGHPLEYAHDLYYASSLATGRAEGFNRPGVEHTSPDYSQKASSREQLVSELATGILLAEHGRPAILAPDSRSQAGQWADQLRKDPDFAKGVFWDVNRSVAAVRQVKQGLDVDYASLQKAVSPSKEVEGKKENSQSQEPGLQSQSKSQQEQKAAERRVELLTGALSGAQEKGGIWMNEAGRPYPSFYPKGPAVSPFNAIFMTLHADQGNYPSNLYTTFSEAHQRDESVLSGQKGVPFLWYNWNKYVSRSNPDEVLSRKQYLELPEAERRQYKGVQEREVRILFNVGQTMTPVLDPEGLKSAMESREEKADLKERVQAFIGAVSGNLVPIQPCKDLQTAGFDGKDDVVRMPDSDSYGDYPDYVHDLFAETVRATGSDERLSREGGRTGAGDESRSREALIVELAAGVKMLELGLPARLSSQAQELVETWNRRLYEDPLMIDGIESDVNKALEVIHKAEKGEEIDYASIAGRPKVGRYPEKGTPQFDRISLVKDDDGRWILFLKPTGQEPFGIHPGKEDVSRFFTAAKEGSEEQTALAREHLAAKYYGLAQVKPGLKVSLLGEPATEEDAARLRDVHIFKNKEGQYMLSVRLSDMSEQIPPRAITPSQWQRLWLSPDQNQYKVNLAAKVFSDVLHPEREIKEGEEQASKVSESEPAAATKAGERKEQECPPILKQFLALKEKHPDALLLFRTGDFYESYKQDAENVSKILGVTLTKGTRMQDDEGKPLVMTGFPYQDLDSCLPKLIRAGQRVAICDQLQESRQNDLEQEPDDLDEAIQEELHAHSFHR